MEENTNKNSQSQIAGAIVIAGLIIAGAILLKGTSAPLAGTNAADTAGTPPAKVTSVDHILGNPDAKVTVILYEDFQCPFCDRFFQDSEKTIANTYVKDGTVRLVYRDFAFLGQESNRAAEAARCAADQGKFWDYHDYLFNHQSGENQGTFADANLKKFAAAVGLDQASFNTCFDNGKYKQAVVDSTNEGRAAGVSGTPKVFILRGSKVVNTVNGALPYATVQPMIQDALK